MYFIYEHRNKVNGKVYVGMTNDLNRRFRGNGIEYKPSGKNKNRPFFNAILKYGWDNFEHVVLEEVETFEEACERERFYIRERDSRNPKKGYNIAEGGNGGRVYKEHPRNRLGTQNPPHEIERQRAFWLNHDNNPMKNGQVTWGETHPHPKGFEGHRHSEDEKTRISETLVALEINCKPVIVTFPEGRRVRYRGVGEAENEVGLTKPTLLKLIRSGEPFAIKCRNQYTADKEHLVGLLVEYEVKDNTEVTDGIKEPSAP